MKLRHAFFFLPLVLLMAYGCATPSSIVARGGGSFIVGVPFYPQDNYMCGPSALASVLNYHGADIKMDDAIAGVYNHRLKGTLAVDMIVYAKDRGFDARFYRGSIEDLKEKITGGNPLILFLNLGIKAYPRGHYIVVVGFSDRKNAVFAHSGSDSEESISYRKLVKAWKKTDFSTILITPRKS